MAADLAADPGAAVDRIPGVGRVAWHGSRPQPPQQERTTRQGGCLDAEGSGNSHAYTRTPPARTGDLRAAAVRRVGYL
jgi:hypothetical protein